MKPTEAITALSALAHEHRLTIFRLLVEQGPEGLPAGVIAESVGLQPSSLTFHLQHLTRAGLLVSKRASRQIFYAADFAAMNAIYTRFVSEPKPARSTVAVAGLPKGARVEIEVVARVG